LEHSITFKITQMLPQLEHRENQIVNCFDVGLVWRGTAMSAYKHQYRDAWSMPGAIEKPGHMARGAAATGAGLIYASPWPWVLALAISSTMWAGIGWLIWKFV